MNQPISHSAPRLSDDEHLVVDIKVLIERLEQHIRFNRSHYTSLVIVPEHLQAELYQKLLSKLGKRLSNYLVLRSLHNSISFLNSTPPIEPRNLHQRICDEVLHLLEQNAVDIPSLLDHLLYLEPDRVPSQAYQAALSTSNLQHPYVLAPSTSLPVTVKEVFVYGINLLQPFERSWLINMCSQVSTTFADSVETEGPAPTILLYGQRYLAGPVNDWINSHPGGLIYTDSVSLRDSIDYHCIKQGIRSTVTGQGGLYDSRELHNLRIFSSWLVQRSTTLFEELYAMTGFTLVSCTKAMASIGLTGSIYENRLRKRTDQDSRPLIALSELSSFLLEIDSLDTDSERILHFNNWVTAHESTLRTDVIPTLLSGIPKPFDWIQSLPNSKSEFTNHQRLTTVHNPYPEAGSDVLLVKNRYSTCSFSPIWSSTLQNTSTFTIFKYSPENHNVG